MKQERQRVDEELSSTLEDKISPDMICTKPAALYERHVGWMADRHQRTVELREEQDRQEVRQVALYQIHACN